MIQDYYELREEPFGVTPDARYLYASATHREALASLLYGIATGRGFVALIAKPGMGKTTLLFHALQQLREKARTVFLFQMACTPVDFLRTLLADLGARESQGSLIELQSKLNDLLVEQSRLGKPLVVVIDEAQNLDGSVLEVVRMLSNFETSREKLIQIILSGQPQLADKLASPELVQLRQRVSIVVGLNPFSPEETALYIDHRLRAAGRSAEAPLFTKAALARIADCSEGIPRNINNLCFNALSLGCAMKRKTIDDEIVREVVGDLDLGRLREKAAEQPKKEDAQKTSALVTAASDQPGPASRLPKLAVAGALLLILAGALFAGARFRSGRLTTAATVRAKNVVPPVTLLVVPPLAPVAPSSASVEQASIQTSIDTIRVTAGKTLYRICSERFGSCTPKHLQEIHKLNPWLSDLDHIETGEKIRVPGQSSAASQNIVEPSDNAFPAARGTP